MLAFSAARTTLTLAGKYIMSEIEAKTRIIEDFEPLVELRNAFATGNQAAFEGTLQELKDGLANEYKEKIDDKVMRWATATVVLRFYDRPPARAYIQTKMLYRDGFYDATIMVARSIAEMICYDRLEGGLLILSARRRISNARISTN